MKYGVIDAELKNLDLEGRAEELLDRLDDLDLPIFCKAEHIAEVRFIQIFNQLSYMYLRLLFYYDFYVHKLGTTRCHSGYCGSVIL
jgi:hypothetical protein